MSESVFDYSQYPYFLEGENRTNIAKRLNTARSSVNKWVSNFLIKCLERLDSKPIQGRPAKLTQANSNSFQLI
ncbi:helix-turn-helix domain-containing protein [Pseudoalteromonas sp. S16_S37]|uniref:helix-turn-helix domain-containing protein n=1 Tax=Pseudoalteromonas sp. S16_S37 TaxID=2720228 RepID=UPI00168184DC|nr:helix-turn-helix domain-containing protein [Pseudoalteromonas sp. S16_S37]MBD1584790.1 helix-turn-helix domain-containing protein [Pseudoalteromonas sp. S16_S37]